jgi:spermidine synthase
MNLASVFRRSSAGAIALACLAALGLPLSAPAQRALPSLAPAAMAGLHQERQLASAQAIDEWTLVYEVTSEFQHITVWDAPDGHRQLIFDGRFDGTDAVQTDMNLARPLELTLSYAQHMVAALPLAEALLQAEQRGDDQRRANDQQRGNADEAVAGGGAVSQRAPPRILIVGLGGASIQRYLHDLLPTVVIETAELDPAVLDVARRFFGFREDERQEVHLGDGRAFIEQTRQTYDLIMLDAFGAEAIPYLLTTREFLTAVKERLNPGGVVAANLWLAAANYQDMLQTYEAVYPEWWLMHCADGTNSVLVARSERRGLSPEQWMEQARAFEQAHPTGLNLPRLIDRGLVRNLRISERARVLVDANAPRSP